MVPPNLSMCMKGDTLSSPYFFLMGKDTVCEKTARLSLSTIDVLFYVLYAFRVCMIISFCMGSVILNSTVNKIVKPVCSGSVCHTKATNMSMIF